MDGNVRVDIKPDKEYGIKVVLSVRTAGKVDTHRLDRHEIEQIRDTLLRV